MEYTVYLTYNCNMRCKYCFAKDYVFNSEKTINDEEVNNLIKFFRNKPKTKEKDTIVFFGGEPTLVPKAIEKIVNSLNISQYNFSMYSNGLELSNIPINILKKFNYIYISIDGDKDIYEKYKPKNKYEIVLKQIDFVKKNSNCKIIGRITVEEKTNIFKSVIGLINYCDYIHWQIVNKDRFINANKFVENYKKDLLKLIDFWFDKLKNDKVIKIIPFQAVFDIIFSPSKSKNKSFFCGSGSYLYTIDINGDVYICDEYVGCKEKVVGNIKDNPNILKQYKSHYELNDNCNRCDIKKICLGRCRKMLQERNKEQIEYYCEMTRFLINVIKKRVKNIKLNETLIKEIKDYQYNTEIIP